MYMVTYGVMASLIIHSDRGRRS